MKINESNSLDILLDLDGPSPSPSSSAKYTSKFYDTSRGTPSPTIPPSSSNGDPSPSFLDNPKQTFKRNKLVQTFNKILSPTKSPVSPSLPQPPVPVRNHNSYPRHQHLDHQNSLISLTDLNGDNASGSSTTSGSSSGFASSPPSSASGILASRIMFFNEIPNNNNNSSNSTVNLRSSKSTAANGKERRASQGNTIDTPSPSLADNPRNSYGSTTPTNSYPSNIEDVNSVIARHCPHETLANIMMHFDRKLFHPVTDFERTMTLAKGAHSFSIYYEMKLLDWICK